MNLTVWPHLAMILLAAGLTPASARERMAQPATAGPSIVASAAQHDAEYWIGQLPRADKVIMDQGAVAAHNARFQREDPTVHELDALPAALAGERVRAWVEKLSRSPRRPLWDQRGQPVDASALAQLADSIALDAIPATRPTRFGLLVARADVRTFPSRMGVFSQVDDTDIDRFQETALFPGTPVAIAHESRDRQWWFVLTPIYAGWVEQSRIAVGGREAVLGHARRTPALVVTGASVRSVFTPGLPAVSELQLDMGVRLPVLADWPADRPVNGQGPSAGHVVALPARADDGSLRLLPALLPRSADVAVAFPAMTEARLLRQAFKFLGERYGWGGSFNGRDCSGFVSDVYMSFGVALPRNSGDQGSSPALNRLPLTSDDDHQARVAILRQLRVGDLLYIPGHVMMVVGFERGQPYVIHDTAGVTYRNAEGALVRRVLNGVSVTPLLPLLGDSGDAYVDRITSIVRIRPEPLRR